MEDSLSASLFVFFPSQTRLYSLQHSCSLFSFIFNKMQTFQQFHNIQSLILIFHNKKIVFFMRSQPKYFMSVVLTVSDNACGTCCYSVVVIIKLYLALPAPNVRRECLFCCQYLTMMLSSCVVTKFINVCHRAFLPGGRFTKITFGMTQIIIHTRYLH